MEEVNITELETRYFADLFACCDTEKTGKIHSLKATEMFRSSDIPNDVLENIISLADIPQTALYMSKVQFYSCLKLIAAYQSSVPLRKELIASTITLPLPKFSWKESPVPLKTDLLNALNDVHSDFANSDITSTDSEVEHSEVEEKTKTRRAGSPAWSTASDSPTPTNSVAERPWAKNALWQGQPEERTQLLGTEEESSDRHSSEEDNDADLETVYQITAEQKAYYIKQFRKIQPDINGLISGQAAKVFFEKSRIPVEELRHIWQLCDVTKDGALNLPEFAAAMHLVVLRRYNIPLPPILPECLIPNNNFYESNQPAEGNLLQLDDDKESSLTNDMQNLSFDNNLIKMKSNSLPHGSNNHLISSAIGVNKTGNKSSTSSNSPSNDLELSPTKSNKISNSKEWVNQSSKEWTKFTESPTSNVSSPGPKPVNFDMQRTAQAVGCNPDILHPKPLRITPVGNDSSDEEPAIRYQRKGENSVHDGGNNATRDSGASSPKPYVTSTPHRDSLQNDLRPIQRPQAKKVLNSVYGAIPPPPQRESLLSSQNVDTTDDANVTAPALSRKDSPPTPPPRSQKHARSSSLDLKKLKLNAPVPPEVPPRISPQMTAQISLDAQLEVSNSSFADFTQCPELVTESSLQTLDNDDSIQPPMRPGIPAQFQSSQRSSAFEVYRKPTPRESSSPPDSLAMAKGMDRSFHEQNSRVNDFFRSDSKNLNDVMCHLKEQNQLLITMCNDLSDELLTVQQRKVELKSKIDSDVNNSNRDVNNQSLV